MSNYWSEREAKQLTKYSDASHRALRKKYRKYYKDTLKDVERKMVNLYYNILDEDGKPSMNKMYQYEKYYQLREELKEALSLLGDKSIRAMDKKMKNVYSYCTSQTVSSIGKGFSNTEVDTLVREMWKANGKYWSKNVWCKDGLNVFNRMDRNMSKLQNTLEKGLLDCVARGASKDELVKTLRSRFDVSYSEADRLARTELTHIQNQSTLDSYKRLGVEQYKYLATEDSRTSDICKELDGQIFYVNMARAGENLPPMHCNCRSTILPVI